MQQTSEYFALRAALEWQVELGVDEVISEAAINRFDFPAATPKIKIGQGSNIAPVDTIPDVVPKQLAGDISALLAQKCTDLNALRDAINLFDLCALKKGARNTVFADGHAQARVMILCEPPNRAEDSAARPLVGDAGKLLDKMFQAIGLAREIDGADGLYVAPILPWCPPQSREPNLEEVEMMLPFVQRHVELMDPEVIILMGNAPCNAVLGKSGVTRLRGKWDQAYDKPVLPMLHPRALLRDPLRKRDAWADLLALKDKLS
ncbi:uracil-DNA glycosylase [Amylibacter marinus]|uniref:Type-4 uracil-DNA glycosylase n=1 Tax=Amylibacter marinus TaxID=1475483 RepID=A0ABQ5VWV7_9RHOB|nr:uracil-DNA glycosylase [Amylibacter marinus]GLQ35907.1 uracil-DNA glycosylase [Amylibacter marinus]